MSKRTSFNVPGALLILIHKNHDEKKTDSLRESVRSLNDEWREKRVQKQKHARQVQVSQYQWVSAENDALAKVFYDLPIPTCLVDIIAEYYGNLPILMRLCPKHLILTLLNEHIVKHPDVEGYNAIDLLVMARKVLMRKTKPDRWVPIFSPVRLQFDALTVGKIYVRVGIRTHKLHLTLMVGSSGLDRQRWKELQAYLCCTAVGETICNYTHLGVRYPNLERSCYGTNTFENGHWVTTSIRSGKGTMPGKDVDQIQARTPDDRGYCEIHRNDIFTNVVIEYSGATSRKPSFRLVEWTLDGKTYKARNELHNTAWS